VLRRLVQEDLDKIERQDKSEVKKEKIQKQLDIDVEKLVLRNSSRSSNCIFEIVRMFLNVISWGKLDYISIV
jgi:hypothetical protein